MLAFKFLRCYEQYTCLHIINKKERFCYLKDSHKVFVFISMSSFLSVSVVKYYGNIHIWFYGSLMKVILCCLSFEAFKTSSTWCSVQTYVFFHMLEKQ